MKANIRVSECQNCQMVWADKVLKDVRDLTQRVAPGEPMPSGECPSCGAVCHPVEGKPECTESIVRRNWPEEELCDGGYSYDEDAGHIIDLYDQVFCAAGLKCGATLEVEPGQSNFAVIHKHTDLADPNTDDYDGFCEELAGDIERLREIERMGVKS